MVNTSSTKPDTADLTVKKGVVFYTFLLLLLTRKYNHKHKFEVFFTIYGMHNFCRQGLADYLGVERSAMSAEISKLVNEGYIETKRSNFKIL